MTDITPLRDFVIATTDLVERLAHDEAALLAALEPKLSALVATDRKSVV